MEQVNWYAYFPMPNTRNIERLMYLFSQAELATEPLTRERRPQNLSRRLLLALSTIGEELLCECVGLEINSIYQMKLVWLTDKMLCHLWFCQDYKLNFHDYMLGKGLTDFKMLSTATMKHEDLMKESIKILKEYKYGRD